MEYTQTHIIKNKTNINKIKKMTINETISLAWWHKPIIPVVVMRKQNDQEFKVGLGYKGSLRPTKATWNPDLLTKITMN